MLKTFNNEKYKGVTLRVVNNILSSKKVYPVKVSFALKGKNYEKLGKTKEHAVGLAKQVIDKIL